MAANHNNLIAINIFRNALPPTPAGFGTVAILAYDTGLTDLEIAVFESPSDAVAGLDDGLGQDAAVQALSQLLAPERVVVIEVPKSTVGPPAVPDADDYADAVAALIASNVDVYGIVVADALDTTIAMQVAIATAVEQSTEKPLFFFNETDEDAWIGALPYDSSGYETIETFERTAILYHDPSAPDHAAAAWAGYRLAFDADAQTALFTGELVGVEADTQLTSTEKNNLLTNNANVALPYFTAAARVALGTNLQGRQIHQILAADWLKARIEGRMAQLVLDYDRRGEIIPLDEIGQQIVIADAIEPVLADGVANGKITGTPVVVAAPITTADRAAFRLPINVDLQLTTGAIRFRVNIYTTAG